MAVSPVLRLPRIRADRPAGLARTPSCLALNAPETSVLSLLRGLTAHRCLQRSHDLYALGPEAFAPGACRAWGSESALDERSSQNWTAEVDVQPATPSPTGS